MQRRSTSQLGTKLAGAMETIERSGSGAEVNCLISIDLGGGRKVELIKTGKIRFAFIFISISELTP
jgi:hypothetical protein